MQKFQANPYLALRIKEADDKKFSLTKTIYEINNIAYEKGSRTVDYALRDLVDGLRGAMEGYYNAIKLFDIARNGQVEVLDDILAFFEMNRLNSFTVREKLAFLKKEIENARTGDREHNEKAPDPAIERRANIYLDELERRVKIYESQFIITIIPQLGQFLTAINEIRLGMIISNMIRGSMGGDKIEAGDRNSRDFKNALTEYLRIDMKIASRKRTEDALINLVNDTLDLMDAQADLVSICGIGKVKKGRIISEVIQDLLSSSSSHPEPAPQGIGAAAPFSPGPKEENTARRLVVFLNELVSLDLKEASSQIVTDPGVSNLGKSRGKGFVFHEPGSSGITLKTVADYLLDSLIFVITWLVRELKKQVVPETEMKPLMESLCRAEDFLRDFKIALAVSGIRSNEEVSVLGGKIQNFIPRDFAKNFSELILFIVDEIHDSFIQVHYNIGANPSPGSNAFLKRVDLVQESFSSARKRIRKGMGDLHLKK